MIRSRHCLLALCVCAALASVRLSAAPLSGSVDFTGGVLGAWSIQFNVSNPAVQLEQVTIQLPATYFFDTQSGGPGYLVWQDFNKTGGGATAVSLTPGTTGLRDGATSLVIGFSGFNAGAGTFTFGLDVDSPAVLQPLLNCGGLGGGALLACLATNTARAAANAVATTNASVVTGSEIAGALVSLKFGGSGITPLTLSTTLANLGGVNARGEFRGNAVPEPGTWALLGAGLAALGMLSRRRKG